MGKPLVLLSALIATALLVLIGVWYGAASTDINLSSNAVKSDIIVFYPPASQPESVIFRHPHADGSADDDVQMRDGTTKHIIYDQKMMLRQVFAYFPGEDGKAGALMYEKEHDASGHLWSEKHLRKDGSLAMVGHEKSDGNYSRQLFYAVASGQPAVASDQLFDHSWQPIAQTEYRPDRTQALVRKWDTKGEQTVLAFAANGKTRLSEEKIASGDYSLDSYLPDGSGLAYSLHNSNEGTTVQFYQVDQRPGLTVFFSNEEEDQFTLHENSGRTLITQVWIFDYGAKAVNGVYPRYLDHVDHFDAFGRRDMRYVLSPDGKLTSVVVFLDKEVYGPRQIYSLDGDGWATKVDTYSDSFTSDGGKQLTRETGKHFAIEPWMLVHPTFQLPKLKDGLSLYGVRPQRGPE